jgi:hypothetical protein
MTLVTLINAAHAYLCEGLDEEGVQRMDRILMGEKVSPVSPAQSLRDARRAPRTGAPAAIRESGAPPVRPAGVPLAPPGVIVREPEPTRGLEVLHAALAAQRGR